VTGFLSGDTIRGVDFHRILEAATTATGSHSIDVNIDGTTTSSAQQTTSKRDSQESDLSARTTKNAEKKTATTTVWRRGFSVGVVANSASFSR
jgi:hypothetical protein